MVVLVAAVVHLERQKQAAPEILLVLAQAKEVMAVVPIRRAATMVALAVAVLVRWEVIRPPLMMAVTAVPVLLRLYPARL
jgi:hypothetical protein